MYLDWNAILVLFLLYTALAMSTEAIFTGIADRIRDWKAGRAFNRNLPCRVSLWHIPVYAFSATVSFSLIGACAPEFFLWPWWVRGVIYVVAIYGWEFVWAMTLESFGVRTWVYQDSKYRVWRYINLKWSVFWFLFGFVLEWVKISMLPRLLD